MNQPSLEHLACLFFEQRAGVALHAVMSKESPQLAELVRHYGGAMILLESDGDFVFGKVQKRVIDTAKG
jgi:hypothetical protein